jgi:hypothetical protein
MRLPAFRFLFFFARCVRTIKVKGKGMMETWFLDRQ